MAKLFFDSYCDIYFFPGTGGAAGEGGDECSQGGTVIVSESGFTPGGGGNTFDVLGGGGGIGDFELQLGGRDGSAGERGEVEFHVDDFNRTAVNLESRPSAVIGGRIFFVDISIGGGV